MFLLSIILVLVCIQHESSGVGDATHLMIVAASDQYLTDAYHDHLSDPARMVKL